MTEAPFAQQSDARAVVDVATRAAAPTQIDGGNLYSVVVPDDGNHVLVDLDLDKYREHPRRKTGTVKLHDAVSFVEYLSKHGLTQSEVWADVSRQSLVAVINAHMGTTGDGVEDYAGWSDHRAVLEIRHTDAWRAWVSQDRKWMSQTEFAEHIEDRVIDIQKPSGGEMLEVAQSISAKGGVEFESSKRLSSGQSELVFKETITAKAGQKGTLEIPNVIDLALVPFEGAPAYKVTARFRYRINGGDLKLCYALDRPEDVIANAFGDIVQAVEEQIKPKPLYRGAPA